MSSCILSMDGCDFELRYSDVFVIQVEKDFCLTNLISKKDSNFISYLPYLSVGSYKSLPKSLKVDDLFNLFLEDKEKILEIEDFFNLKEISNKRIEELSLGYQNLISVIISIVSEKSIIFLVDPFNFLDNKNREKLVSFINKHKANKIIIILTKQLSNIPFFTNIRTECLNISIKRFFLSDNKNNFTINKLLSFLLKKANFFLYFILFSFSLLFVFYTFLYLEIETFKNYKKISKFINHNSLYLIIKNIPNSVEDIKEIIENDLEILRYSNAKDNITMELKLKTKVGDKIFLKNFKDSLYKRISFKFNIDNPKNLKLYYGFEHLQVFTKRILILLIFYLFLFLLFLIILFFLFVRILKITSVVDVFKVFVLKNINNLALFIISFFVSFTSLILGSFLIDWLYGYLFIKYLILSYISTFFIVFIIKKKIFYDIYKQQFI